MTAPPEPKPDPIGQADRVADLLAHIRLLQEALDATAPTEAALLRADRQIAALQDQIDRLSRQIREDQREAEARYRQLAKAQGSLSWRLTTSLRMVRGALGRIRHRVWHTPD